MDLTDKKILCELDVNCRLPLSRMARKLRIGRNVLDYRIKRMEREGIIDKYICHINLGKLGYKTYKIYCKMKGMDGRTERDFIDFISSEKQVIHFLKTEGSFDFVFAIAIQNIRELDSFLSEMKNRFRESISDYFVSTVVSSIVFKFHKFLLDETEERIKFDRYTEDSKEIELDEKDRKILGVLSQEANLPLVRISEKTGYGIDVVKHRLKGLSKNVVSSFRITIRMSKLGYFHYVIMIRVRGASSDEESEFISWCANKKNVMYLTKRIGVFDYEVNVAIRGIDDLNSFIAEMKNRFGNIMDSHELIINNRLLKLNYLPF
jgi:Lrp/AsnC family transcriptional regulator